VVENTQAMSVVNFSMLTDKKEEEIVWLKLDPEYQITHFKSLLRSRTFHCANSPKSLERIQPLEAQIQEAKIQPQEATKIQSQEATKIQLQKATNLELLPQEAMKLRPQPQEAADLEMQLQERPVVQVQEVTEKQVQVTRKMQSQKEIGISPQKTMKTQETLQINLKASSSNETSSFNGINKPEATGESRTDVVNKILLSKPLPESFAPHKNETVKLITVIDSGGQPEYIHMLPAINNCPTINFVVHDMTKKLDDPVMVRYNSEHDKNFTDYPLHYSHLDMIGLLMSLTTDSLEQPTKQTARVTTPLKSYVGFVGTHKDKLEESKETIEAINDRLACMVEERNCRFAVLPASSGILFAVDNTTAGDGKCEDVTIKQLRLKVENFMDELTKSNIMSNQLPIRWMILDLELQQLHKDSNPKFITYQKYKEIATKKASMVEEEVEESLQYFDFLGVLLHFKEVPDLCNYVFINHQWLFDKLAMIMHLSPKDINFCNHFFRKQFKSQRLLVKNESKILGWKGELPQKYFFDLLEYLKVIATVKLNGTEYYYMPCILSSTTQYDDKYRFLRSEPLLVQFSSGFLLLFTCCSFTTRPTRWMGSSVVQH